MPAYDIAVSFAGEDRAYVDDLAKLIRESGLSKFYDDFELSELWGKDLYQYLHDLYSNKAKYCLVVISADYVRKAWTRHELKSAQERAFRESHEYILPIRLDDTAVPGIPETTGYLDARKIPAEQIVTLLLRKLGKAASEKLASANPVIDGRPLERILWLLPRGFVILEDITYVVHEAWHVICTYFTYQGEAVYGTHYHQSYGPIWSTDDGRRRQLEKLMIPAGDWGYADWVLRLVRHIRDAETVLDLREVVETWRNEGFPVFYYAPGEPIFLPDVPEELRRPADFGSLRDVEVRLSSYQLRDGWPSQEDRDQLDSYRRKAVLEAYRMFGEHPAYSFVKDVSDEFKGAQLTADVQAWINRMVQTLKDVRRI